MNTNIAKKILKTLICIAAAGTVLMSAACAAGSRVALQDEAAYISVDETNVSIVSDASDASDFFDRYDVSDVSDAYDFFDAFDVSDVSGTSGTYDFFDASDVSDVPNVLDFSDVSDVYDTSNVAPELSDMSAVHYATPESPQITEQNIEQHIEQRVEPRPEELQIQIERLQQAQAELIQQSEELQAQIEQLQQTKLEIELQAEQQARQQHIMRQRFQPQVDLLTRQLAECVGSDRCALISYQLGTLYYTAAIQNGGQDFSMVKQHLQRFLNEYPNSLYAPHATRLLARIESF